MKNFWKYTAAVLLIILLFLSGCVWNLKNKNAKLQKDCDQKLLKADTITIRDTVQIAFNTPVYVPKPYRIEVGVPVFIDTSDQNYLPVDTANILKDYFATVFYSDNQKVKDSSGNIVGEVIIKDEVSRNRIKQRQVTGNIQKETVTNYITNTIQEQRKNELFIGLNGMGNKETIAAGVSFLFMQKRGFGIEAGAMLDAKQKVWYTGSFKLKLSK